MILRNFYRSFFSKCDACEGFRRYSILLYFSNASDILILCSSSLRVYSSFMEFISRVYKICSIILKYLDNADYEFKIKSFLLNKMFYKCFQIYINSTSQISQITKFILIFRILFFGFMRKFLLNLISLNIVDLFVEIGYPLALASKSSES